MELTKRVSISPEDPSFSIVLPNSLSSKAILLLQFSTASHYLIPSGVCLIVCFEVIWSEASVLIYLAALNLYF